MNKIELFNGNIDKLKRSLKFTSSLLNISSCDVVNVNRYVVINQSIKLNGVKNEQA